MSIEGSAFGRQSDVFPVTAPLRPIRPTDRDRNMLPQPRSSSSGFDASLVSSTGQGNDRSSARQVSVALPIHIRKPIGLLLGSLLVKDLSTCTSTWKAGLPFLPSILVSWKTCKSGFVVTVLTKLADGKPNRLVLPLPKGDRWQARADDNNLSDRPSHLKADNTDERDETIKHIEFCDRQLDALDRKARSLSINTNWTYWHLAKAYEAFCVVSTVLTMNLASPQRNSPYTAYHRSYTKLSATPRLTLSFDT